VYVKHDRQILFARRPVKARCHPTPACRDFEIAPSGKDWRVLIPAGGKTLESRPAF
jgi:hypothetical protein